MTHAQTNPTWVQTQLGTERITQRTWVQMCPVDRAPRSDPRQSLSRRQCHLTGRPPVQLPLRPPTDYEDDFLNQLRQDYELRSAARLSDGDRTVELDGGPPFGRGGADRQLYVDEVYDDDSGEE